MSMYNHNEMDSETNPLISIMGRIRSNSHYPTGFSYTLLKRYFCLLVSSCLISTVIFSIVFYLNINYVYNLYSDTDLPNPVPKRLVFKSKSAYRLRNDKKNTNGLTIYDYKIKYKDFNYLNSETLTYENRTYANKIPILFRMPEKRGTIGLLLIFHGCSRSAHDWFHTVERQRIIGAAIDLGYGCLAFQATDQFSSCWSSDSNLNDNEDVQMVIKGLENFYKEFSHLESLPRFTFGASSGGVFSSIFVTNQRYKIQGQILFISIIFPPLLETHIKTNTYPPTAWIYMPRDIEFASETRINDSIKIFIEQKIPYQSFIIKPIRLTQDTFHQRIPTIATDTSRYIFFRFQQNKWLNEENHLMYNPRRIDTWKTFLLTPNNSTSEITGIIKNLQKHKDIIPDFLNTIYGEHEISFERSYEALKWHLCIYNNQTDCIM